MNIVGTVLELSEDNIAQIMAAPENYMNLCFVTSCSKRRHMSKFNRLVIKMISIWRHYNWTFVFTNTYEDLDSYIKMYVSYKQEAK
jgi:hypothetical protein